MVNSNAQAIIKEQFDRDGYVIVRDFLDAGEREEIFGNLDRYIEEVVPTIPVEHRYYEDVNQPETLKQMQYMQEHSPFFDELPRSDKFRQLAELLLDGEVVPKGTEWFNKPPKLNKPTPPHQDGYYFMLEPNEAITMWIPTDPVDESNGCLRYVPGSHLKGVRPHTRTNTLGFSQGIVDYGDHDRQVEQPMILQPGDIVIHHSLTVHRADANDSDRNRAVIGLVYYSTRAKKDEAASAAYQERLHKDLEAAGRI